jgi:hypothetical protein
MTNNIRERIKRRSEMKLNNVVNQKGGLGNAPNSSSGNAPNSSSDKTKKRTEFWKNFYLGINSIKLFFKILMDYIHTKIRPLFNIYYNWTDIFEIGILPGESKKITELTKEKINLESKIKKLKEKGNEIGSEQQELDDKKKKLANIKNTEYISVWAYFIAFVKSFFEQSDNELTPQEKIMKKRGNKYGNIPKPSIGFITKFFKPIIVIVLITVSILANFITQKKYINQLLEQKTDTCLAIFQSKVYTENIKFNTPYYYFYNTDLNSPDTLYLRDFYVACSYKTYLACGYETQPALGAIKYILNSGARVLHFDVFEDVIMTENTKTEKSIITEEEYVKEEGYSGTEIDASYVPMVRSATNDVSVGISLVDVIEEISNANPFGKGADNPLIIYLDMWYQDSNIISTSKVYEGFRNTTTYDIIYDIIEHYFGKSSGKDRLVIDGIDGFGYGGTRVKGKSIGNIPMYLARGKLLLISNINTQGNYGGTSSTSLTTNSVSGGSLSPYLYGTVSYPTISGTKVNNIEILNRSEHVSVQGQQKDPGINAMIYGKDLNNMSGLHGKIGGGIEDFIAFNQSNVGIAIPEIEKPDGKLIWKNSLQNPNFLDCFQFGMQFVFMNYQECLKETNNYIQFFVNHGQQFVVKRHDLRQINHKNPIKQIQNIQASYKARSGPNVGKFFQSQY